MWFAGVDNRNWQGSWQIGYAESKDGRDWSVITGKPVITLGSETSWKSNTLFAPDVLLIDNVYHIWFVGRTNVQTNDWRIGHATSFDGISWTEDINNPIFGLGPSDGFGSGGVAHPSVTVSSEGYHMWYSGFRARLPGQQIGLATSKDGTRWLR